MYSRPKRTNVHTKFVNGNFLYNLILRKHMIWILYHLHSGRTLKGDSLFKGPPLLLGSVLWFCDKGVVLWWSWLPLVRMGSSGISTPCFLSFFCFILRFWNQILTWVSLRWIALAISILLDWVGCILKWNSLSNSVNWLVVKLVLPVTSTCLETSNTCTIVVQI